MRKRRIACDLKCILCNNCPVESSLHLLFLCPYAVAVWFNLSRIVGFHLMTPGLTVQQIFLQSRDTARVRRIQEKIWAPIFVAACWQLWKERNKKNLGGQVRPPEILAYEIAQDSELWRRYCWKNVFCLFGNFCFYFFFLWWWLFCCVLGYWVLKMVIACNLCGRCMIEL